MLTNSRVVDRFFRVLVEEIRVSAPRFLDSTFTVAEIYQTLIPYRTHRDRLGVEMNGDYEDALLRLLGGEGDYLVLESEPARARIRMELEHDNPNTGVYRDFAAVDVRLNQAKVPDSSGEATGSLFAGLDTAAGGDAGSAARPVLGAEAAVPAGVPSARRRVRRVAPSQTVTERPRGGGPEKCPECDTTLPARESLRFCPECGTNVLLCSCTSCEEVLERAWKYCVACGTPTGS